MKSLFHRATTAASGMPPPLILSVLYAVLIVLGAAVLKLPFAHTVPITWSDAIFTSTSAVTVTGLVVIDTGAHLTLFGQMVVAFLIQMGGLGLMTFAVLILGALGLPVGITGKLYLREDLNQSSVHQLSKLVLTILKVVVVCEVAGAMLLALTFVPHYG
ncbi:MAG: Ktr system potassium transporter B, partial [Roseovarius sp.]|nr:Ktr system potassium transporter B [Roseovarius sp.]